MVPHCCHNYSNPSSIAMSSMFSSSLSFISSAMNAFGNTQDTRVDREENGNTGNKKRRMVEKEASTRNKKKKSKNRADEKRLFNKTSRTKSINKKGYAGNKRDFGRIISVRLVPDTRKSVWQSEWGESWKKVPVHVLCGLKSDSFDGLVRLSGSIIDPVRDEMKSYLCADSYEDICFAVEGRDGKLFDILLEEDSDFKYFLSHIIEDNVVATTRSMTCPLASEDVASVESLCTQCSKTNNRFVNGKYCDMLPSASVTTKSGNVVKIPRVLAWRSSLIIAAIGGKVSGWCVTCFEEKCVSTLTYKKSFTCKYCNEPSFETCNWGNFDYDNASGCKRCKMKELKRKCFVLAA